MTELDPENMSREQLIETVISLRKKNEYLQEALDASHNGMKHIVSSFNEAIDIFNSRAIAFTQREKDLVNQNEVYEKEARTDYLTDLPNKRAASERFDQVCNQLSRTGGYIGSILLDLDHFKSVNDVFGHEVGDQALKHVASILANTVRGYEMPFRYGGEEMGVILSLDNHKDHERAIGEVGLAAERVRMALEKNPLIIEIKGNKHEIILSASIGAYVERASDKSDFDMSFKKADKALYTAKDEGRNGVAAVLCEERTEVIIFSVGDYRPSEESRKNALDNPIRRDRKVGPVANRGKDL